MTSPITLIIRILFGLILIIFPIQIWKINQFMLRKNNNAVWQFKSEKPDKITIVINRTGGICIISLMFVIELLRI
jgi:hypothetical protein